MKKNIRIASVLLFENKIVNWRKTLNYKPTIYDLDTFGDYKEKEVRIETMMLDEVDFTEKEIDEKFKKFFSRWDIHEDINIKSPLKEEKFMPKSLNSIKKGEFHPVINQKFWFVDFQKEEGVNCFRWDDKKRDWILEGRFGVHETKKEALKQFKKIEKKLGLDSIEF